MIDRIGKRVYAGECVGSCLIGRPRKRWIDSMNDCLNKKALNVGQAGKMMYERNEWQEFVRVSAWGIARG